MKYSRQELKQYILDNFSYVEGKLNRTDRKGGLGSLDKDGYLIIKVKGVQFKAHHIVWLLCNGDFPKSEIDHINRNRTDNRIENLRESNRTEQCRNHGRLPNKDTGVVGIYLDNTTKGLKKKYTFHLLGKSYRFYTLEEAIKEKERLRCSTN